jgi:uncharacterized cupredoxin-like copper-binding protein
MRRSVTVWLLALACVLAACGGGDTSDTPTPSPTVESAAEIPVVEITKTAEGFEAPASIPGGLTRLRIHNADTRAHAVNFLRFEGDGTLDQLVAAYTLGSTDFMAAAEEIGRLTTADGGSGLIAPGGTAEIVMDLVPGRYAIYRFPAIGSLPGAREMEVTAAPDPRPAPPESAFTVDMLEFAYDGFPDTLPAGKTTFEVVNEGEQFHLMDVRRVNEQGITAEQVLQHLRGTPQPVAPTDAGAGGMGELEPGDSGWVTLDLEPGVYTLICLVFDQQDGVLGKLHTDLGMHHTFTVQ